MASVMTEGQEYPLEYDTLVQANAGVGMNPNQPPLAPYGYSGSPDGLGSYSRLYQMPTPSATNSGVLGLIAKSSPLVRGLKAVSGLGDDAAAQPAAVPGAAQPIAAASGLLVAAVIVGGVLTGVSGYYVGKAIAPSHDREAKYAWWGVAAALLGGPLGLGIEAAVALSEK